MHVLCLLVLQQPHESAMVGAVLQQVLWLLECAGEGLLPADVVTGTWQVAAAAVVAACVTALDETGLLGMQSSR